MRVITISFKSINDYTLFLREVVDRSKSTLSIQDVDSMIVAHSELETSLLDEQEKPKLIKDLTVLKREIKDRMNAVYFDHRGRPDYDGLSESDEVIEKIVFSYFQRLLEDKPEVITLEPNEGLTEERKLYGAFCVYADFYKEGYFIMGRHQNDSKLGRKIIDRLHKSNFTATQHVDLAFSYILGVNAYQAIKDRYCDLTADIINGPLKEDVIQKVREHFAVK